MEGFVESAFFTAPQQQLMNVGLGASNSPDADDVEVDSHTYREASDIIHGEPFHLAIRRYLIAQVLRVPPEINLGNETQPPELIKFVEQRWIAEQVPKIMDEGWTLGLAPVELKNDPDTDWPIPHVYTRGLGTRYKIDIHEQKRHRSAEYRFYHIERKPGKRGYLTRSHKVVIYGGFDAEPVQDTGRLTSVVAALIPKQREYDENYRMARVALMNMARPMVLLETTKTSQGMDSVRPDVRMPFYGGQDWMSEDRRERVAMAATDLDVVARQQQAFWNQFFDQIEDMARQGTKSVHQAHLNLIPLPADHRSASYQGASMRTDWREMTEIYEDLVTSAYGIQRAHLHSTQGRLQISEALTNAALVNVINRWRDDLSRVFTDLYRRAFGVSGEIVFPREVNDTAEGLFLKWQRGLLTWEGLATITSDMTGIDPKYMKKKEPPLPQLEADASGAVETSEKKKKKRKRSGEVDMT